MHNTEAIFEGCKIPKRKPDFISESGSKYWLRRNLKGRYIVRLSNHWVKMKIVGDKVLRTKHSKIASCKWHLKTTYPIKDGAVAGKCYLGNFKRIF